MRTYCTKKQGLLAGEPDSVAASEVNLVLHTRNSFFIDIEVKILIMNVQEDVVMDEITVRLSESLLTISHNLKMALRENRNLLHCS